MDRESVYRKLVSEGYTMREIAKELNVAYATVQWWVAKYGLNTKRMEYLTNMQRKTNCSVCNNDMPNNIRNMDMCGSCRTKIRRFLTKQRAIDLLGGKCISHIKYFGCECIDKRILQVNHIDGGG